MTSTFVTADWHLGHANIIRLCNRPFGSLEEMHRCIERKWNEVVGPTDQVFVLGDCALDPRGIERFLARLSGKKVLVAGNHDKCPPCHRRHERWVRRYLDMGFADVVTDQLEYDLGREIVTMCHFPSRGDSGAEERYTEWRPKRGAFRWLLHGHIHERRVVAGRELNVGVDAWNFAPVELDHALRTLRSSAHV